MTLAPTRFYVDFRYNGVAMDWWTPTTFPARTLSEVKKEAYKSICRRQNPAAWDFDVYQADCYSVELDNGGIQRCWSKGKHIYYSL